MAIRKEAYKIVLKVGNKFFAGHVENFLSVKPSFEPILKKSLGGKLIEEFVRMDLEAGISGLTYVKSAEEAATHDDFQDIRITAASGGAVAFVFGELADGKPIITGTGKIFDYFETEGSSTAAGTWGCKLRTLFGGAVSGTYEEPPVNTNIHLGLLYNWFAAVDPRNICSPGWHINTTEEAVTLRTYLDPAGTDGINVAGTKLKEFNALYWNINTGTNEANFNARGSGTREFDDGTFTSILTNLEFWRSNQFGDFGYYCQISASVPRFRADGTIRNKKHGMSLRPIKDSTTLTHGQEGQYTDPSGITYRTICIGNQEWVADNIATRHYRNGDPIPEVTDNAAWAALTTGALCAYNNDWNNV